MSPQSTRETMRRAVKRAIRDQNACMYNLKTLDRIAADRSENVKNVLPVIIETSDMIRELLKKLLASL